ncbi:MAG: amidohydrolase, partial [Gemmatimonadetes bacterium]|nr:amidohydrolase [Gemmatimonadota bacterium]
MRITPWLVTGALLAACGQRPPFADVVFTNGAVLTMDSANPTARAVAIRGGRIVYVGSDEGAQPLIGTSTRVLDLGGKTLLPGFQDAHVHPISSGLDLAGCDVTDLETREAVLARIAECAVALPAGEWLVGSNWALPLFPNASPTRE